MKRSLILIFSIILAVSLGVVSCTPENMPEDKYAITIKYDLNGGVGDTPASQTLSVGDDDKISDRFVPSSFDGITRDGYYLYSWNTKADGSGRDWFPDTSYGGLSRKSFRSESTVTLYAIWIPVFDNDGILYEKLDDGTCSVVRLTDSYSKTEVIIPDTVNGMKVTSINSRAFNKRKDIVSVKLPSSINNIGAKAFSSCLKLTSINIPEGVKKLENGVFWNCVSLDNVTIPSSVEVIDVQAFYSCSSLKEITIGSGVKDIYFYAFEECTNLTSINIPSSVVKIEDKAFAGCKKLAVINIDKEEGTITGEPWGAENGSLVIKWKTDEESKDSTDTEKKDDSDTTDKDTEETGTKELDESTIEEITTKNEDITKAFGVIGGWVDSFTKKEVSFTSTMTVDVTSKEGVTFATQEEHNKLGETLKKDEKYKDKEYKGSPKSYTAFSFKCNASPKTTSDNYIYWDYSKDNYIKYKITEETTLEKDKDGYISYKSAYDEKGNYLINFDNYLLCDIEALCNAFEMSDNVDSETLKNTITRFYSILSKGATVKGNAEVKKGEETLKIAFEAVVTADESTRDIKIEMKSISVKIGEEEVLNVKFTLTVNLSSDFKFIINDGKMGAPNGKAELKLSDVEIKVYKNSTLSLTSLDIVIDGDKPEITFEVKGLKETVGEYSAELVKLKFLFDSKFLKETEQPVDDAMKCLTELEFKIGDEIYTKESVSAVIKELIEMFTITPSEPPAE